MKIKILYAEDDEFTRKFEIRRLKECGFNVSSVEDGQEAWDEYQKGRYDLLLLDGDMPKMQGEEVMRLVREAGDDIAIVMYSGLPDYSLLNEWRIKTAFRRSQERKEMNRLKAPKAEKRKTFWDRFKRNS